MPAGSSRTAEEKKQEHIDAIKERITEDIGPVIEESIQRSVQDYAVTRITPIGNEESQVRSHQAIEKFRSLIPRPTFDDLWTQRDEDRLKQDAERDAEFEHCCTYQDYISATWKTAYKFMGCLATDIIGPKSYLVFHDDHAASKARFWATRFCRKLSSLIVQPVFAANPERLALAIQWTVICRTGDRRKWRLSGCNDEDEFLRILKEVVGQSQDGTEDPRTLRLMALRLFKRKYGTRGGEDPLWCQFLQRIEEKAPESTHVAEQGRDSQYLGDFEPYRVGTTDLANLLDAIREVRVCGFPKFHDPTTVAMTLLYTRDAADLPLRPQVMEATRAVLLSQRREARRPQKLSMLDIRGSLAPSQSGGAQDDVDEERDLGHPQDADLNLPSEHLDEVVTEADIFRENAEEQAEEVEGQDEQAAIPEMGPDTQGAARWSRFGEISSSNDELENAGKTEQPEDVGPAPQSPARAMPGRPQLHQPDTAANAQDHQNNGEATQQGYITARKRQRTEVEQMHETRQDSAIYTAERFAADARGDPVHEDRAGRRGSSGNSDQDGQQALATLPNDPNGEQPATRAGQQILGKRQRESYDVESAGEFEMPYFREDEVTIDRNSSGHIIGMRPIDPHADGSNMVVLRPGLATLFQLQPLTQRGKYVVERLFAEARLGSSNGNVAFSVAPVDPIDPSHSEPVYVSSTGQLSEPIPLWAITTLGLNQDQIHNRTRNQIQGPVRTVPCTLCNSSIHRTGQCPIPSSVHHGDTAVCGPHNSSTSHHLWGHAFDSSMTWPLSTCRLVRDAQYGINIRGNKMKENYEFLIKWLVVERQHKAPIRVEDHTLDFVGLVIDYSREFCNGEMPQMVNFKWPYTKAEARRYESTLRRYDELGPDQMPRGMLDGKSMAEIRAMRNRGGIPLQVYNPNDPPATNPEPAE